MQLILIPLILGFSHLIGWLVTKGIIWVAYELFNTNWYDKFWVVYVALIILNLITKGKVSYNKK